MRHVRKASPSVRDDYLELVKRCPLKPLRDETEYDAATAMLDTLVVRTLSQGEQDYLDALTHFVEDYDHRNREKPGSKLTPLSLLKHLLVENQMTSRDLGKVLGSPSSASMILHGRRGMSKAQIMKLAERFHVDPSLFLR
jgi:HTH-type transcriptional regulator/antitoxin HigA